jgi:hypothetical protein
VREFRSLGSVRGALSNGRPYRDPFLWASESIGNHDSKIMDACGVG